MTRDFNDILQSIGPVGTYQLCLFLMLSMLSVFGVEPIATNFIAGYMEHWCEVEELLDLPHSYQKDIAIPYDDEEEEVYSSCEHYDLNYSSYSTEDFLEWNRSAMVDEDTEVADCEAWVYDQSVFVSTIQSQVRSNPGF